MTVARRIENQITRQLLQRREEGDGQSYPIDNPGANPLIDRLIAILAVTAGLLIVGSYLEELLWAILAATTAITLR